MKISDWRTYRWVLLPSKISLEFLSYNVMQLSVMQQLISYTCVLRYSNKYEIPLFPFCKYQYEIFHYFFGKTEIPIVTKNNL